MVMHIQLDCPYEECLTEKAGFTGSHSKPYGPGGHLHVVFLQCGVCGNAVVAKYQGTSVPSWVNSQGGMGDSKFIEAWPKRLPMEAPQHLPTNIASYYLQGLDNLKRKNFDAAGTMFRKSLDIGLKRLDPAGKGSLEKRIDSLSENTGVTPAMKNWAHEIRHLGNDAAHEDEPFSPQEAGALQSFTELFLTYAFTLPGMLIARQQATTPAETP
jgi:hypothetical protein